MKNKYFTLFVAVVLCFTFLFGMTVTALDAGNIEIPNETVGDVLEGVLKEDPGVVGEEIKEGIYEGRDFLQVLTDAIDNLRIIIANFLADFFKRMDIGQSESIFK